MRLLHTSDWHLGRSLHQYDLAPAQAGVVDHLVELVRAEGIDAVLLSGDVHDRALPPVEAMQLFDDALRRLRDAGAAVVAISGNHDAPARLGDKSGLLDPRISLRTDPRRVDQPVLLDDQHGPVAVYAVPYLEPAAVADLLPADPESSVPVAAPDGPGEGGAGPVAGAHSRVLGQAMRAVHRDRARRGGRSVVLAHAWVTGGEGSDSERDITVGGVANVPARLFDGIDYTALGHLHRPQTLSDSLRYSGSPLPYSFSEAGYDKSSWVVELDGAGLAAVERVAVPVHRRLSTVRGALAELLSSSVLAAQEQDFVAVVLTDTVRPLDAMACVRRRFPYALTLEHEPACGRHDDVASYGRRTRGRTDLQVAQAFVAHVRSAATSQDGQLLRDALESATREEGAA